MGDPIQSLDDLLVSASNSAVRMWNSVTGRTRADLSTLLIAAGSAPIVIDSFNNPYYPSAPYVAIPAIALFNIGFYIKNRIIEKREIFELDHGKKDNYVEFHKRLEKNLGILITGFAGALIAVSINESNPEISRSGLLHSINYLLLGAGLYITAVNAVLPRKYISRAYDKVSEKIRGYWGR
jgi:hypothetical protein